MIGETAADVAMPETLPAPWRLAAPPDDCPVRLHVTPGGITLAFFHATRPLPPFTLTIPHAQWAQMVQLVAETAPHVPDFEVFVGFTPESLALHRIDAVEIPECQCPV